MIEELSQKLRKLTFEPFLNSIDPPRHWHSPMHICFSLELEGEESGFPAQKILQADEHFEIDYIRAWHRHPNDRHETSPGLDVTK